MQQDLLEVKRERFLLSDSSKYLLQGLWPQEAVAEVWMDREKLSAEIKPWVRISALDRFVNLEAQQGQRIEICVQIPEHLENYRQLRIYAVSGTRKRLWYRISVAELRKKQKQPHFYIEELHRNSSEKSCSLRGWTAAAEAVEIRAVDRYGTVLPCKIDRMQRIDVQELYAECRIDPQAGFCIEIKNIQTNEFQLQFLSGGKMNETLIGLQPIRVMWDQADKYIQKARRYARMHGIKSLIGKVVKKL